MKKNISGFSIIPAILMTVALGLFSSESLAQDSPKIVSLSGKAQILAAGKTSPAKVGQKLMPGEAVQMVGDGEVRLSAQNGKIKISGTDGANIQYDGQVNEKSQPWQQNQLQTASLEGDTPQFEVPAGKIDVQVIKGQQLRINAPLVTASVRGTRFTVAVSQDGSSKLATQEGVVATLGRQGESRLARAGEGMEVTSAQYTSFLESKGVVIPAGGDWRSVDAVTLEQIDSQTFENSLNDTGSISASNNQETSSSQETSSQDSAIISQVSTASTESSEVASLDALLASPDSHPMAADTAITSSAGAPVFQTASFQTANIGGPTEGSLIYGGTPAGSVADASTAQTTNEAIEEILEDNQNILNPFPVTPPFIPSPTSGTAHVSGNLFALNTNSTLDFIPTTHAFSFDINIGTGAISNGTINIFFDDNNKIIANTGTGTFSGNSFSVTNFIGGSFFYGTTQDTLDPDSNIQGQLGTGSPLNVYDTINTTGTNVHIQSLENNTKKVNSNASGSVISITP